MTILARVKLRVDSIVSDAELTNCIDTITDRLCLRLGVDELPGVFETICADAVVKMVRRFYYEGISTEGVTNISTSFVADILEEYEPEINDWKNSTHNTDGTAKGIRFL